MTLADDRPADARECIARFCSGFLAERVVARGVRDVGHDPESAPPQKDQYGFALPPTHPYPGLRSFATREARLFFGRQGEADELRRRLSASNVVVVLGGSGSGKSSLALAGVLPRLNDVGRIAGRTGRWYAATFRPGDSPCERMVQAIWADVCEPLLALDGGPQAFTEILLPDHGPGQADVLTLRSAIHALLKPEGTLTLAGVTAFLDALEAIDERLAKLRSSLRSGPVNFLLLIDQFEELFRDSLRRDKREDIEKVVDLLEYARNNPKGPLVIIATLRSEELHRCAEFDRLAPIVNHGFYLIDHPKISALIEAAVKPGRQTLLDWDVEIEDDGSRRASALVPQGEHAPFSIAFLEKLQHWVERFQGDDDPEAAETEKHNRHQADFLPLFQHLLRISWSAAVDRWNADKVEKPTIEAADIEDWVENKQKRVAELRSWLASLGMQIKVSEASSDPDNMLEVCFNTGFAIAISEAITGKPWDQLKAWPKADETMKTRLRAVQLTLVALATRDDKGNDARRPARAAEILEASSRSMDLATLESVISFFKARNYLRGGKNDEPYDVNHEALIRNSSEYQAWLADAKKVANSLYDANAALAAGETYGARDKAKGGWQAWAFRLYSDFTLSPYYEAAERLSGDRCRDLERIFGTEAVFDPEWMAERAELPGTKEEQQAAIRNVQSAWENAHRWRVDFSAGQKGRPSVIQRIATFVKRVEHKLFEGGRGPAGAASEQKPVMLPGRELLQAKIGAAILLVPIFFIATPALGYLYSEISSSKNALEVLAVTADVAYPKEGPPNEHAQKQIVKSGKRIEQLQKTLYASKTHQRDLTLAVATFGVAARSYLGQIFFSEAAASPPGRKLSCIRFDGSDAVGGYKSISSPTSERKFAVQDDTKRLVPMHGAEIAEILTRETTQVLAGESIACGVSNLDFLIVWTQLSEVSNPLVYPVNWYWHPQDRRHYAKMDQPMQPRYTVPDLSSKITDVGKRIAGSLASGEFIVTAQEDDRSHWVIVTIDMPGTGSFELRFARGVQSPLPVSAPRPPVELGECKRVSADETSENVECVSRSGQASTTGIRLVSKAFDRNARTGEATRRPCDVNQPLCVHRISILHSPSVSDTFNITGAAINNFIAPPIRNAGFWEGYLVLKDTDNVYRSVPMERTRLLEILAQRRGPADFKPTTTCEVFGCEKWPE